MSKIIIPDLWRSEPEDDKPLNEEEKLEVMKEAQAFGQKAIEKLHELEYRWNGEDWEHMGGSSDA